MGWQGIATKAVMVIEMVRLVPDTQDILSELAYFKTVF